MKNLLLFTLLTFSPLFYAQDNDAHRIVFQMSSANVAEQEGLIRNLENLLSGWNGLEAEVVAHGPGISFLLTTSAHKEALHNLLARGVRFINITACLPARGKVIPRTCFAG